LQQHLQDKKVKEEAKKEVAKKEEKAEEVGILLASHCSSFCFQRLISSMQMFKRTFRIGVILSALL